MILQARQNYDPKYRIILYVNTIEISPKYNQFKR